MKKREWLSAALLTLTVILTLSISIYENLIIGIDRWKLFRSDTELLLLEATVVFGTATVILWKAKENRIRIGLLMMLVGCFTWIHQVFLPVLLSGIYLLLILRVGRGVRKILDKDCFYKDFRLSTGMADFALGCVSLILLYCIMSLVGIGSITEIRTAAIGIGIASFLPGFPGRQEDTAHVSKISAWSKEKKVISVSTAVFVAFILAMLLLQVGRMNICPDYDSLHYGLRSEYVLNDGDGIYENLGSINVVYTYSKGLETLLLPLSGLPSYSFFMGFQMWMTLGILLAAGEIAKCFVDSKYAVFCMALLASIPGIMNMGITAKTDAATALFQLIMTYYLLQFAQKQKTEDLAVAGNAFLLTMVLKPTALVFSTILAGTTFIFFWATKTFRVCWKNRFLMSWIPAIVMWLLIWLRTWLLTGIPVTSVFTSIWIKLGFQVKYPFLFDSMPSNGSDLGWKDAIKHFVKRLYGVLLAPVGEDMFHVKIAWGTCLLLIFLILFLVPLFVRMKKLNEGEKRPLICLVCVFLTNGIFSLVALYLLWQVDGNYFILLYCLFTMLAVIVIGKMESRFLSKLTILLLVPVMIFNVSMTAINNWHGALGLNPIKLVHAGYYDHWEAEKEQMVHKGNEKIWEILAEDPETRVIVYGNQPEMLMFPCNAQSYLDICGSGGNYYVSASVEGLVDYFDYAEIKYVYLSGGYLKPGTEAWKFVIEMMEAGYLTDIFYENGNALAKFSTEPVVPEKPEEVLEIFAQHYWPGEQQ